MQDGEENSPLERELEVPLAQQREQDLVDRTRLPEALEDKRRADPGTAGCDALAAGVCTENGEFLREAAKGLEKGVQVSTGEKFIQAAEAMKHSLLDLAVNPMVVDDEEISAGTVGLSANEHGIAPVSLVCRLQEDKTIEKCNF